MAEPEVGTMALRGRCAILNVGRGDTKLTFDPEKPVEREQAAKAVTEMIRLGFAVMVEVGERDGKPLYQRAHAFDEKTCEYIIVGVPDQSPLHQLPDPLTHVEEAMRKTTERPRLVMIEGGRRAGRTANKNKVRIKADKARSVAVAPSAGG